MGMDGGSCCGLLSDVRPSLLGAESQRWPGATRCQRESSCTGRVAVGSHRGRTQAKAVAASPGSKTQQDSFPFECHGCAGTMREWRGMAGGEPETT